MIRRFQMTASLIILVIITWSVSACNSTPEPPQVSAISANPGTDIMIGESASLTVKASGQDLQFNWSAARGKLSSETAPSVIYEAPDSPGPDTVTVNVVGSGGATTIQSITFQVVAPTPTPTPSSTPSPMPTYTPMPPTDTPVLPTNTPSTPTNTPTPTPTSTAIMPTPFIIDHMDSALDWEQYRDDKGSSIVLRSTSGMFDNAVEISFDLKQDGYVGIAKEFYSGILSGTEGIEFSYSGSGAPNTIELKLLYAPDSDGKSAVFSASWHHITATNEWKTFEVPYTQFGCWVDTGCVLDEEIDLERIWKVDFAISNKLGDTPGIGVVAIDNVQGINLR